MKGTFYEVDKVIQIVPAILDFVNLCEATEFYYEMKVFH